MTPSSHHPKQIVKGITDEPEHPGCPSVLCLAADQPETRRRHRVRCASAGPLARCSCGVLLPCRPCAASRDVDERAPGRTPRACPSARHRRRGVPFLCAETVGDGGAWGHVRGVRCRGAAHRRGRLRAATHPLPCPAVRRHHARPAHPACCPSRGHRGAGRPPCNGWSSSNQNSNNRRVVSLRLG
jgi:hypothetical protein